MTSGEYMVSELIKKRKQLDDLREQVLDLEADLCGAEINYKDYEYAAIDFIDGDEVVIDCENGDDQWEETITLEKLLEIMK